MVKFQPRLIECVPNHPPGVFGVGIVEFWMIEQEICVEGNLLEISVVAREGLEYCGNPLDTLETRKCRVFEFYGF